MTDEQKEIFDKIRKEFGTSEMRKQVIEKNYGLDSSYKVICDETNNTPEDAENGMVNVDIIITQYKTIDQISLSLVKTDD